MDQDLDTPTALAALVNLAGDILTAAENGRNLTQAQETLRRCSTILGLRLDKKGVEDRVTEGWQNHRLRFEDF
jgi:hypothetical protein